MAARKNPPVCIDLTGQEFGYLTVVKRAPDYVKKNGKRETAWLCRCVCDNEVTVIGYTLKRKGGKVKQSCGCRREELRVNSLTEQGKPHSPFCREEVREKAKNTIIERYGTDNPGSLPEVREKCEKTCLERYGVPCALQHPDVAAKSDATNLQRYGVKRATQLPQFRVKALAKRPGVNAVQHWATGETLLCERRYELLAVDYLNHNRISYQWQQQCFFMPDGRTYTPDIYLPELDLWVEVKGRWFDHAVSKFLWFRQTGRDIEVWDEKFLKRIVNMNTPTAVLVERNNCYGASGESAEVTQED